MYFTFTQCKQKGFTGIYILIILLILGGLGGAYYFSKSSNKSVISQINPTITQQPTKNNTNPASTDAGETANWKTYTNNFFDISFKYPPDLSHSSYGSDAGNTGYIVFERDGKGYFVVNLSDNFAPANVGNFKGSKPLSKRIIGGKEWDYYSFYYQDELVKSLNYNIIKFETVNNNFLYSFTFENQIELSREQDQILSTFKFTQ